MIRGTEDSIMRQTIRPIALAFLFAFAAVMLAGCRPSQVAAQKSPPKAIHGELITAASNTVNIALAPVHVVSGVPTAPAVVITPAPATAIPKLAEPIPVAPTSGYADVGFDRLASYNFEVDETPLTNQVATTPDKADDQIPPAVKALNQKKVSIKGFMLPLKVADGTVTEFLIMKDQSMCCYGSVPKITEWVSVKTTGKGVKPIMDQPISILGTLHIGAVRENGYLVGIYQMDGDKLVTGNH